MESKPAFVSDAKIASKGPGALLNMHLTLDRFLNLALHADHGPHLSSSERALSNSVRENPVRRETLNSTRGDEYMKKFLMTVAVGAAFAVAAGAASAQTLNQVKQRGALQCGANTGLAGFGQPDAQGNWTGLDVDFCRAIAAAIFNDPTKVKFAPLSAKDRFTALQSGEVDVLVRNTTWTMSRDTSLGLEFAAVNYYDGQGFMVRKKLKVNSALELSGASVCSQQGTTTELNLADFFRANKLKYEPVIFATSDETIKAYDAGRCDVFTTDASGLYAERLKLSNPDDHMVLPDIISKEPLGPSVRHGDNQWNDIVKWVHYAMLNAEELGVTKANVDEQMKSANPEIKRLLGVEGQFGEAIGLTNDWVYRIIKHVGNYGESFERNVGQGSRLKIARGTNALWNKGGLQYAPPIR
ncbi:HisJ ABC-type amino acid transport/signal transduction systems, periplasmic component/domain [Rhabdaerophilaceae bacterium]